jgi:hypothetical protein
MRIRWLLTCAAVVALGIGGVAPWTPQVCGGPKAPVELLPFTPERETAALRFVQEHHPELSDVLTRLKTFSREQYEQAVRQLFQESEKLAAVKTQDDKLHELMLEYWKVNSRIEVLAARLAHARDRDAVLEAELKTLLYRQADLQRQMIEHNRQRTLAALKVMEANIKLLEEKREEMVERRFRTLTSGAAKSGARPKAVPAPAKP